MLLRQSLGEVLRELRQVRGLTLRELSRLAKVSLGYISEIERGQKEASSELLASLCAALQVPLSEVLHQVSVRVHAQEAELRVESVVALPAVSAADVVASAA